MSEVCYSITHIPGQHEGQAGSCALSQEVEVDKEEDIKQRMLLI